MTIFHISFLGELKSYPSWKKVPKFYFDVHIYVFTENLKKKARNHIFMRSVSLEMWLFFACYCCGQSGLVVKMSSLDTSRCENSRQKCWKMLVPETALLSWVRCLMPPRIFWDAAKIKAERWKSASRKKDRISPFFLFFEKPFRKQLKSVLSTCCFLRKIFFG